MSENKKFSRTEKKLQGSIVYYLEPRKPQELTPKRFSRLHTSLLNSDSDSQVPPIQLQTGNPELFLHEVSW